MLTRFATSRRRSQASPRHPHRPTPILAEGRTLREPRRVPLVVVTVLVVAFIVVIAWAAWSLVRQGEESFEALHQAEADHLSTAVRYATTRSVD